MLIKILGKMLCHNDRLGLMFEKRVGINFPFRNKSLIKEIILPFKVKIMFSLDLIN
jgi:hypothetical protein